MYCPQLLVLSSDSLVFCFENCNNNIYIKPAASVTPNTGSIQTSNYNNTQLQLIILKL